MMGWQERKSSHKSRFFQHVKAGQSAISQRKREKKDSSVKTKQKTQHQTMKSSMCQQNLNFNGQMWWFLRITAFMLTLSNLKAVKIFIQVKA